MPGKPTVQSYSAIEACPVCAGEFFQQFRGLSTGKRASAITKDFGQVPLCYYPAFGFRLRPGFWDVFGPAAGKLGFQPDSGAGNLLAAAWAAEKRTKESYNRVTFALLHSATDYSNFTT